MRATFRTILVVIAITAGTVLPARAAGHAFILIDYPGARCTFLEGVNNAGDIVGRRQGPPDTGSYNGFVYRNGAFIPMDFPGSSSSGVRGINSFGDVVGFYQDSSPGVHGFRSVGGSLSSINAPGAFVTFAEGINDSGKIVGFADSLGFLFAGGTFTPLGISGAILVQASDINNGDAIAGSYQDSAGFHGFLYQAGVFSALDVPGSSTPVDSKYSLGIGINNAGHVVGGYYEGEWHHHGFVHENGIFSTIDIPGASYTIATGINDAGDIVGYYLDANGNCHGFLVNTIPVTIDIKRNKFPGRGKSSGVIPVAILSSPTFDAREVNPATLTLDGSGVVQRGKTGEYACNVEGANLICQMMPDGLLAEPRDTVGVLRGQTFGGQLIRGQGSISFMGN